MALNNLGLGITLFAKDMMSPVLAKANQNLATFDKAATRAAGGRTGRGGAGSAVIGGAIGAGAMGAGILGLRAAFGAMDKAAVFERGVAAVGAVAGATGKELDALREAALKVGSMGFSPTEGAGGLRELAAAGYSAKESIALLVPTLQLAAGSLGELDPTKASGLMSQTLKAFSLDTNQAAAVGDKLLQAANMFALAPGELPEAIGIGSRGAQAISQSLDETLISLGLVKNIIPGIERASTGVAVAMERMAKGSVQKKMAALGVQVADSNGNFKDFLDILTDLAPKLEKMSEQKRAGWVTKTFGAHALGAIQAIMTQIGTGVKDAEGKLLRGADAVKYLREQFAQSAGTAHKFHEAMLNTFAGQRDLLKSNFETLAIVVGEPLAKALKPVVKAISSVVSSIVGFIKKLPAPVKETLAKVALAVGAVVTGFGAFIALKAGIAALSLTLGFLGISLGGVLLGLLPIAAVFAGVGIAAWSSWDKIKLFAKGMWQLFSEGGFTGQVREELNKTGNEGVKGFAIQLYVWLNRIKGFFLGVGEGLRGMWDGIKGALGGLGDSLGRLGVELGLTKSGVEDNRNAYARWADIGKSVGKVLGMVVIGVIQVMTAVTDAITWVASFRATWHGLVGTLGGAWDMLSGIFQLIGGFLSGDWDMLWKGAVNIVIGACKIIVNVVMAVAGIIAKVLDALTFGTTNMAGSVEEARAGAIEGLEESRRFWNRELSGQVATSPMPAVASQEKQLQAIGASAVALFAKKGGDERPINVSLEMDNERFLQAQIRAKFETTDREFGMARMRPE